MTNAIINKKIRKIIGGAIEEDGYRLVLHTFRGNTLQLLLERKDNIPITIDECVQVGRKISPILEEEKLCNDSCSLEVSSAGIDRPLVVLEDFVKFTGHKVKLELSNPVNKKKRFTAQINSIDGDTITFIDKKDEVYPVELDNILSAKLVITNELIEYQRSLIPPQD